MVAAVGASLRVITGNRLELLLQALADRLAAAPLPPLVAETIVVPAKGMARWLLLELARRHGTAAAFDLPFPGAFLQQLGRNAAAAADGDRDPAAAFAPAALELRVFRLLGEPKLRAELGAAAAYCRDDGDQQKRLQLAQRVAACFDDYQLWRDDALLAFERGDAIDLPHAGWQGALWRELLREVGALAERREARPPGRSGQGLLFAATADAPPAGAHRLQHLRTLLADPAAARRALPPRLSVFGLATLPPAFLDLLVRIAAHIDVTIYAPKPTPHFYGDLQRPRPGRPPQSGNGPPLLAAFGRQSREFFDLLLDGPLAGDETAAAFADPGTDTLLHTLQHDLHELTARGAGGDAPPLPLRQDDDSLTVHSVHGPLREMEVVRDQILQALVRDRTMTPADVMVLVPDVQEYAPYVHAVFRPLHKLLPFHVADRSPAAELPVPATFLRLCALARGRFQAADVLLLLEEPALARRFSIARPDLVSLRAWVHRTRIRWGLDGAQRQADLGLPADDGNTWRHGLDRLVLGLATGDVGGEVLSLLPAGSGSSNHLELLGRFVAFVDAIAAATRALARPHTLSAWASLLEDLCERLFLPVADDERQGRLHLLAVARQLRQLEDVARLREELSPAAFTAWLERALAGLGESRGFLTGAITFAALRPMRTVPVRMLCLVGLADGRFPRRAPRAVFDLQQHQRRRGDRNAADDDRQLFLDALLAARDRLVLTYVGRSQKDNSLCAPSPVLSELQEHIDRAFSPPPGHASARAAVFVDHPLQSFSPRYGGDDQRLFTHGRTRPAELPAAAAATAPPPRARLRDAAGREIIELGDLLAFWRHPVRWYCQHVLDLRFPGESDRDDDAEPFELHGLDTYQLVDDAVNDRIAGRPDLLTSGAVRQTGVLPPGALGAVAHHDVAAVARQFHARLLQQQPFRRASAVVTGADYVVRGDFATVAGDALVLWRPSKVKDKDRLRAFVHHALLCTAVQQQAELPARTRLLAVDAAIDAEPCWPAQEHLDRLVQGFRQGRTAPLPFFEHASAVYAAKLGGDDDDDEARARRAARKAYQPPDRLQEAYLHDLPDPCLEFCFGDRDPIALPEFATWATTVFAAALTFFGQRSDA